MFVQFSLVAERDSLKWNEVIFLCTSAENLPSDIQVKKKQKEAQKRKILLSFNI